MTEQSETKRLNQLGAEWAGLTFKVNNFNNSYYTDNRTIICLKEDWNPCHNLNHTYLVEQAMIKKGWSIRVSYGLRFKNRWEVYLYKKDEGWGYKIHETDAPIGEKALAIMRAFEMAVEKGEG